MIWYKYNRSGKLFIKQDGIEPLDVIIDSRGTDWTYYTLYHRKKDKAAEDLRLQEFYETGIPDYG